MALQIGSVNKNKSKIMAIREQKLEDFQLANERYKMATEIWKRRTPIYALIFFVSALALFTLRFNLLAGVIFLIGAWFIIRPSEPLEADYRFPNEDEEILIEGMEGEEETLEVLKSLSDDYIIFSNSEVLGYDFDFIVLGPTGVFIIENKPLKGLIKGHADEKEWFRTQKSRVGKAQNESMFNPCYRVETLKNKLARYLRIHNCDHEIEGILFFSSFETKLDLQNPSRKPIFSIHHPEEILSFIQRGKHRMSIEKRESLKGIITRLYRSNAESLIQTETRA